MRCIKILVCLFILQLISIRSTHGIKFFRTIQAVGFPYYKIMLTLGTCKENILFMDNKIWGNVKLNRILDIYYKSTKSAYYKVSRVEIKITINNTDCFAHSKTGIGSAEFSAALYLPLNSGIVFYNLNIFTCNKYSPTCLEKAMVSPTLSVEFSNIRGLIPDRGLSLVILDNFDAHYVE
ncbi:uncharacterized protein ACR2FA_005382 [Aphomia sociella]